MAGLQEASAWVGEANEESVSEAAIWTQTVRKETEL